MNTAQRTLLLARKNPRRLGKILLRRLGAKLDTGLRFGTELELATLERYAGNAKVGIVEIGVLDGGTTREMALFAKVPMYGIDPIIVDSMKADLKGHEEIIRSNMSFYKQFSFFKDYSFNVAKSWDKPFDFIFIDGDHSYEACKQDFEDWYPLLSSGGFVAFHDSAPVTSVTVPHKGYEGPIRVVTELKKDSRVAFVETADSITVFRKTR